MLFGIEMVKKVLPHRDPFLFVDSVTSLISNDGKEFNYNLKINTPELVGCISKTKYFTREDHPIFAGHFPGNPILPGVVQVEMMAQSSCFNLFLVDEKIDERELEVALLRVESAKFRKPIIPNMNLEIECLCTKVRGMFMEYDCKILCEGQVMSEATVLASVKVVS